MAASTPPSYFVIESRMRQVAAEIQSTVQSHIESLIARREQLLKQLEHAMVTYTRANKQDQFTSSMDNKGLLNKKANFLELTMSKIQFQPPDTALEKALSTMGVLLMPSFAPFCTATGDGLEYAIPNVSTSFTIATRDCFNEEIPLGGETITIEIISYTGNQRTSIPHYVIDHTNGKYTINYCLPHNVDPESHLLMSIDINGLPMNGSPFRIQIQNPEKMQNWHRLLTFGTEGSQPGAFCRPWGVAIARYSDTHNNISSSQEQQYIIPVSIATQLGLFDLNTVVGANNFNHAQQLHHNNNGGPHLQNGTTNTTNNSILNASSSSHNHPNVGDNDMYWDPLMGHATANFTGNNSTGNNSTGNNSTGNNSTATTTQCKSFETSNSMASSPAASSSSHSSGQQLHQSQTHSNIKLNIDSNYRKHLDNLQKLPQSSQNEINYLIGLADRSNNRIQLFKFDSLKGTVKLIHVFGSGPGARQGQFDRPAGIVFNTKLEHIIVADKDNHRIQVFDMSGTFLFKFGERGSKCGQFCYPWDIDVCKSSHNIVVSDTRNRRIQIFNSVGSYLAHFHQPLDSPRGVVYLSPTTLIVSDFNKHRLLLISSSNDKLSTPSAIGSNEGRTQFESIHIGFGEGSSWGEFLRPQGMAYSGSTVFCADSRNNRITCWNEETQTFTYISQNVVDLDRPAGIAAIDNYIVIVDFGNNRVHICHR